MDRDINLASNVKSAGELFACEAGTAILEFAIILPILVAIAAGGVELGRALFIRSTVECALRGGARLLAQTADPTCTPVCSGNANKAIMLAHDEIIANAGLGPDAVTVRSVPGVAHGTVILSAEVKFVSSLLPLFGRDPAFTLSVRHQEQIIVE